MPFMKGQSGNPSGRPKIDGAEDIKALARQHTSTAIDALVTVASGGRGEQARVAAAVALLDRGWGKPTQHVDLDANVSVNADADLADAYSLMDEVARARAAGFEFKGEVAKNGSPVAGHA